MNNVDIAREEYGADAIPEHSLIYEGEDNITSAKWYRHLVAEHWYIAKINDETYLPFAAEKRLLIKRIFMPPYIQTLEFFGQKDMPNIALLINKLITQYKMGTLSIPYLVKEVPQEVTISKRDNFIIDLFQPYQDIRSKYNRGLKHRINKFYKRGCRIAETDQVDLFLKFYIENIPPAIPLHYRKINFLQNYFHTIMSKKAGTMLLAYSPQSLPLASVFFIHSHSRVIYILSAKNALGKEYAAVHACLDYIIKKYAGQRMIFDFEGSMVPNIASFFKSYGAQLQNYYNYTWNRSPALKAMQYIYHFLKNHLRR